MADTIKLVQGDSYPTIKLTLYEGDGDTRLDLTENQRVVEVHFREAGTTGVSKVIGCGIIDAVEGEVSFDFSNKGLFTAYKDSEDRTQYRPIDPGQYEGEIVVRDGGGKTETVYDVLRFRVRERLV